MALGLVILIFVIVFLIASLPLHISVNILGGDSTILKAMVTNAVIGLVGGVIYLFIPRFAGIVYFIAILLVYKLMFNIGWIRAVLVWVLQVVIAFLLIMLLMFLGVAAL